MDESKDLSVDTRVVRNKPYKKPVNPLSTPIFSTSTYVLESAEHGKLLAIDKEKAGSSPWLYSRWSNPTVDVAEHYINDLEHGKGTLAFSSGMAAVSTALISVLRSGDHVIAPEPVYSGTFEILNETLRSFGVETTFVNATDSNAFSEAVQDNTRVIYVESPANPTMSLTDLWEISSIAKSHGLISMIDSTFASPINQNPIDLGIDVVIHSATKYLGGHSDIIAGSVTCATPELHKKIYQTRKLLGGMLSPQDAFLLIRGIKTLAVRMERHNSNALQVAEFLESHPKVHRVYYPGLISHPQYELAKKQMRGFSGMIAFEVEGGLEAGKKMIEDLSVIELAVSLGGVESLIEHAASMTHGMIPREERLRGGVTDGLLRLSVGIEYPEDIIQDLNQSLSLL